MTSMLERAIHAGIIIAILLLGLSALRGWQKRKAGAATVRLVPRSRKPTIVYFYSAACAVCRSSQRPTIESLVGHVGSENLQLIMVDVAEQVQTARDWAVTTVPSTFVVRPGGDVAHVNNGLAGERLLRRQLSPWLRGI